MGAIPESHVPGTASPGELGLLGWTLLLIHCQFHTVVIVTEKAMAVERPPTSMVTPPSHPFLCPESLPA